MAIALSMGRHEHLALVHGFPREGCSLDGSGGLLLCPSVSFLFLFLFLIFFVFVIFLLLVVFLGSVCDHVFFISTWYLVVVFERFSHL